MGKTADRTSGDVLSLPYPGARSLIASAVPSPHRPASIVLPSRPFRATPLLALAVVLLAPALGAQGTSTAPPACPPPRSYAACAIRVEQGMLSGLVVVRGADGARVGRVTGFGGSSLATLLQGSDSAVAHARRYATHARRATVLAVVGGVLLGAAAAVDLKEREVTDAGLAYVAGAAVVSVGVSAYALRAQRELSRAVWWYNSVY